MNGKDMFLALNYVSAKFVDEAETVTNFKQERKLPSLRKTLLIAAIIALMLFLMGCAVIRLISLQVRHSQIYSSEGELVTGEEVHFEGNEDVFIELGAYYPQQIPEGYSMTFVSEGAPLQNQRIVYENAEEAYFDFYIMIGDPASNVEVYNIMSKEEVNINGNKGILYSHDDMMQTLVWIAEEQGFGFVIRSNDMSLDLVAIARCTAPGEPLIPTRAQSTVKALEQLGDVAPSWLPVGFEEQGVMGSPLEEGGDWYSYVRKWYVNKAENQKIYFEYESYAIDTEMGYKDTPRTACSFRMPGSDILAGVVIGEESEINGMYALVTGNHIAWADEEKRIVYHLTSEDVLGEELLKVAKSIGQ